MKSKHIYKSIACGVLLALTATSCDLDYNPVDSYSDVTEGVDKTDEKPIFNSVQDVETSMVTLHKKFRDQQEHWYVDKLLIGDAHSDNAYAGTTGAEVVPYETNSIEGSNSVLKRDWDRFLGDIAEANRIIVLKTRSRHITQSVLQISRQERLILMHIEHIIRLRIFQPIHSIFHRKLCQFQTKILQHYLHR